MTPSIQTYWSLHTLGKMFTQTLFICCFLCLEYSSPRYLNGLLSYFLQVFGSMLCEVKPFLLPYSVASLSTAYFLSLLYFLQRTHTTLFKYINMHAYLFSPLAVPVARGNSWARVRTHATVETCPTAVAVLDLLPTHWSTRELPGLPFLYVFSVILLFRNSPTLWFSLVFWCLRTIELVPFLSSLFFYFIFFFLVCLI